MMPSESGREFIVHVPLADEKEIGRMVVERKKRELMSKYASAPLQKEQEEAKDMLSGTPLEEMDGQLPHWWIILDLKLSARRRNDLYSAGIDEIMQSKMAFVTVRHGGSA